MFTQKMLQNAGNLFKKLGESFCIAFCETFIRLRKLNENPRKTLHHFFLSLTEVLSPLTFHYFRFHSFVVHKNNKFRKEE